MPIVTIQVTARVPTPAQHRSQQTGACMHAFAWVS